MARNDRQFRFNSGLVVSISESQNKDWLGSVSIWPRPLSIVRESSPILFSEKRKDLIRKLRLHLARLRSPNLELVYRKTIDLEESSNLTLDKLEEIKKKYSL